MLKKLKLGQKFFLTLIAISVVPLLIISVSNYYYLKNELRQKTIGTLTTLNDSGAKHINQVIQLRQEQAKELAGTYLVRQLAANGVNPDQVLNVLQAAIESIFGELKSETSSDYKNIDTTSDIVNISVWDSHGNVVANTDRSLIGRTMSAEFLQILYEKGAYFMGFDKDPLTGANLLTILEEIHNWETNEYAGVVLLQFSAKVLNDVTAARQGMAKTVETYIVDKKKRMITDSRFVKNAILKTQVETSATQACFAQKPSSVMYKNYQAHWVLGTQQYLPDQQWCILTEIGAQEAFQPVSTFRNQIVIILVILILFILFFVKSAGQRFIAPITMLRDAALKVARGNYDVQIQSPSQDEIGELSSTFNQMTKILASTTTQLLEKNKLLENQKEQLKKFDQLKSEFVSTVSHELRTPMTIIKESIAQLLEEENIPRQEKNLLLTMAINNINRLANLINNLLDLSKIEAGKVELHKQKFNLANLVQEVCKIFEAAAHKKGIAIRWASSPETIEIFADRDKLTQVFMNLIGNSMKFVEKGYIEVAAIAEDTHVKCIVADTGPGITKENLQKVFNKFQQFGHQAAGGVKGTGLGLSICKGLIDLHGGEIWVESEAGRGTSFIFTLPSQERNARG